MIEIVQDIALGAGAILLQKLHSGFEIHRKGTIDLVTDADRAAEAYVVEQIAKLFPEHSICAEEGGITEKSSESIWYIDPLDGTTNFAHGFPYFSVSIALAQRGEVVLGVVYNPVSRECFVAEHNQGAYLNGRRLRVSTVAKVQDSLLFTGFPYDIATTKKDNLVSFAKTSRASQGVRTAGSAALDLCQVASGRCEAFWERQLQPWDLAAGGLMVTEAGGQISGCSGEVFSVLGQEILASNGLVHHELLGILLEKD